MKISLNIAQSVSNVPLNEVGTEELVRRIGAQLGAVEGVWQSGDKYNGVVVAKIVSCHKHPDADKLNICYIDDSGAVQNVERNTDNLVQVVCGAPNAREGLLVAWIPPGTVVPSTFWAEQFTLEARDIRGQMSNGMLGSPHELAISDNHDGILEIEEDVAPGTPFKQLYDLDDVTIEVENKMFTHRPDCFGVLGIARELAGIQGLSFQSPEWYVQGQALQETSQDLPLEVAVECPELVPRFMAVAMKDVKIGPSPVWLQAALTRVAIKSINNVVDVTNYLSYVTAQPLHAYDYDKVRELSCEDAAELIAKKAKTVDEVALLNGKTIAFADPTVLIATSVQPIGVGGVMGGKYTEVDNDTKNIILECASFDMYNIRRTSMKYGLFTDAVTRFTKGQSPLQNDKVMAKAMEMVTELAGGIQASTVIDIKNHENKVFGSETMIHDPIMVSASFINERLGLTLSEDEIITLLENVEFDVDKVGEELEVQAPFWRTDIEIKEDVVEEVGRLHGYDKVPLELPKRSGKPTPKDPQLTLKQKVRDVLSTAGANEVLTYSFVHGKLLEKARQDPEKSYKLTNALSPDLQYYRQTLVPSLLDKIHQNIKASYDEFAIFELNKTHNKIHGFNEENVPGEINMIALVCASKAEPKGAPFYQARAFLDFLATKLGLTLQYDTIEDDPSYPVTQPYNLKRSAYVSTSDGVFLGMVGEFHADVARSFKLPSAAGFEIGLEALLEATMTVKPHYSPLSRFPSIEQDISLRVESSVAFSTLQNRLIALLNEHKPDDTTVKTHPQSIFQKDESSKNYAFRVNIVSDARTLQAEAVNTLLDKVAAMLNKELGAERV